MRKLAILSVILLLFGSGVAFGWHDKTHMAISQAAGYENWFNSAGADITKTKAGNKEAANHWFNNNGNVEVSDKMVMVQVSRYDDPKDEDGHLCGAIIASLRNYISGKNSGKYADYNLAFCAHYVGDLSMPFHNIPFGESKFNDSARHTRNDGVVEASVMNNIGFIQRNIYTIAINNEDDLAREIARIANLSHQLALRLEKENRDMTQDEAYVQISHSASLLKAILIYAGRIKK